MNIYLKLRFGIDSDGMINILQKLTMHIFIIIKSNEFCLIVFGGFVFQKNKQKIINKVLKDANVEIKEGTKNDNSQLLYLTGNGGNSYTNRGIRNIAIFVIAIIMVCTMTVIYNSFNMSVIERIRYFGILK